VNLGSGKWKLDGYVNVDSDRDVGPDVRADAVTYLRRLPPSSVGEIYMGHFLEHLERADGLDVLRLVHRVLRPGGLVGAVVPDTAAIIDRVRAGDLDLDEACHLYFYSTVQPSRHRWAYDEHTLGRLLEEAGFEVLGPIDRMHDRRLVDGVWWQCGLDARKPVDERGPKGSTPPSSGADAEPPAR
jgi:predicted SAM-dependent methyltransferase